jgi:ATP-dependent DNA ligase
MNRNPYIDLEPGETPSGFDLVELKYDGMWASAAFASGECVIRSRNDQIKARLPVDPKLGVFTLIGEYMRGTPWSRDTGRTGRFYAFDMVRFDNATLRDRRRTMEQLFTHELMPEWMRLVEQYPAREWKRLWSEQVKSGQFEGLVFKQSDQPYGEPWGRMKARVTADFVCMGVNRGSGRLVNTAGSIQGGLYVEGRLQRILNVAGFTDEERDELWTHPEGFVGRVFEVCGNARFESGALRHPRFLRWREDKLPRECAA